MSAQPHLSVLRNEVIAALSPAAGDIVVDGTFGAGGYSRGLLEAADCTVIGIDQDPSAQRFADALEGAFPGRVRLLRGNFRDMADLLDAAGVEAVDGVTLDLGVSSMQLDQAERGFSFLRDGPLDMRMSGEGPTAADLVNTLAEKDLADLLYRYGEERKSRPLAKAIVAARPLSRTGELVDLCEKVLGKGKKGEAHPATRTFQALRIAVNDELAALEDGLSAAERVLKPGGRLAIVAFHSLEDRIVKLFLRDRSGGAPSGSRHRPEVTVPRDPSFTLSSRKAATPGADEIAANPRARSAKLRWAIRTDAPAWPSAREAAA